METSAVKSRHLFCHAYGAAEAAPPSKQNQRRRLPPPQSEMGQAPSLREIRTPPLQRETIQEREIAGDEREVIRHQQNPQHNQQTSTRYFHGVHMELKSVVEL
jgi:hypothetical protein